MIPDYISGSPLFLEMHDDEIQLVVQDSRVLEFKAGDVILKTGDAAQSLYVILVGEAIIEKSREGRQYTVEIMKVGDVFGEVALMAQKSRQNNVVARKDITALKIDYDAIFSLYKKKPKIFGILILNIARLIGKRLTGAYEHLAQMANEAAMMENYLETLEEAE